MAVPDWFCVEGDTRGESAHQHCHQLHVRLAAAESEERDMLAILGRLQAGDPLSADMELRRIREDRDLFERLVGINARLKAAARP